MTCNYATLTETTSSTVHQLPYEFQYEPHKPIKRISYLQTAKGVVSQKSDPLYTYGNPEDVIKWKITLTTRDVAKQFHDLYNNIQDTFRFQGYWGEDLLVSLDKPMELKPVSGYFEISGEFQVICVTSNFQGCTIIDTTTTTTT